MAPGRRGGGRSGAGGGGGKSSSNSVNRKPQANNHSRKARGAAAAAASSGSGKSNIKSLANVFSLEDDDESKSARRRKQYLDEVENYEYNVDEIEDEDDEEIDSDEAFDEEDEIKYENFKFYGSKSQVKKNKKKQAKAEKGKGKNIDSEDEDMDDQDDSEEDEEEESEEEGAEYMDISEMLDRPEEEEVVLPKKTKVAGFNDFESDEEDFKFGGDDDEDEKEEEEDEDEEEEDEEEDEDEQDDEMEEDGENNSSSLTSFIDSLETKTSKRKQDDSQDSSSKKARKALRERTEAYDESEYNLQAHRSAAAHSVNGNINKKKLDIFDLVSTVQDEAGFSSLKKNIQALENGTKKGKTVETLSAPLPKIVQDRLNRQAAYDETKKEVSKWLPIVQKNRQAEHLAFPMNAPPVDVPSSSTLASKFDASTQLEKEVQEVLVEGGMQEKKLMEFEELALNKMTTEEVEKRRSELRMMRDLMFREEIRAKRISKIKSKLYRKIKKKERERNGLTSEEMAELDPEQAREERMLAEQKRAQERMTLKHKNTGKWAKDQLKHGNFDPESRQAITEQIERGERLRRKIQDVDSDEELSGGDSEYSDFDDDDIEGVKARAFDELAQVERQLAKDEDAAMEAKVGKGVFAMKFMQDAAKRSKMQAQAAADDFRREMMEEEELRNQSSEDEWKTVTKGSKKAGKKASKEPEAGTVVGAGGRMVFGASSATPANESSDTSASQGKAVKMNSGGQISKVALSAGHTTKVAGPVNVKIAGSSTRSTSNAQDNDSEDDSANPWLQNDKHGQGKIARKNDKGMTKDSSKSDKLQAKLKKQKAAEAGSDDEVQIDTSSYLTLSKDNQKERGLSKEDSDEEESKAPAPTSAASKKAKATKAAPAVSEAQDNDGDDSDASEAEPVMVHAKTTAALSQRDLVARAFANDNVVSEFEKEKMEVMEAERPKDVDMTLPGWGSWGGKGAKKKKNVVVKKAQPGDGVEVSKRKDAKLAHVIINEKRDKKAAAYSVTQIPHPFKTWAQYEQSLRAPVGKEWNTNATFQKMTMPRITTKLGKIIDPLTAPFK